MSLCNQFPALLWTATQFDGRCYFYPGRDCPGWERGSICARIQVEIPMTEDAGFQPEPAAPPVDADPQQVAEEAAAAEPGTDAEAAPEADPAPVTDAPAEPAQDAPAPPVADPNWLLDLRTQHPGSALLTAIEDIYRRLRNLGG